MNLAQLPLTVSEGGLTRLKDMPPLSGQPFISVRPRATTLDLVVGKVRKSVRIDPGSGTTLTLFVTGGGAMIGSATLTGEPRRATDSTSVVGVVRVSGAKAEIVPGDQVSGLSGAKEGDALAVKPAKGSIRLKAGGSLNADLAPDTAYSAIFPGDGQRFAPLLVVNSITHKVQSASVSAAG